MTLKLWITRIPATDDAKALDHADPTPQPHDNGPRSALFFRDVRVAARLMSLRATWQPATSRPWIQKNKAPNAAGTLGADLSPLYGASYTLNTSMMAWAASINGCPPAGKSIPALMKAVTWLMKALSSLMAQWYYHGLAKPAPVADTAVRLSETPGGIRHRAPVLGEHTGEVLAEIGYDESAVARLREAGVV